MLPADEVRSGSVRPGSVLGPLGERCNDFDTQRGATKKAALSGQSWIYRWALENYGALLDHGS
jgi:hypothetical protein